MNIDCRQRDKLSDQECLSHAQAIFPTSAEEWGEGGTIITFDLQTHLKLAKIMIIRNWSIAPCNYFFLCLG